MNIIESISHKQKLNLNNNSNRDRRNLGIYFVSKYINKPKIKNSISKLVRVRTIGSNNIHIGAIRDSYAVSLDGYSVMSNDSLLERSIDINDIDYNCFKAKSKSINDYIYKEYYNEIY